MVAPGDTITLERAQRVLGTASNTVVLALTAAIFDADGAGGLRIIHDALASGADARQFARQMVSHLRTVLLLQAAGPDMVPDLPDSQQEALLVQAGRAPRPLLIDAVRRFQDAAQKQAISWQPQLPLELAFMELLPVEPLPVFAAPPPKRAEAVPPKPAPADEATIVPLPPAEPTPAPAAESAQSAAAPTALPPEPESAEVEKAVGVEETAGSTAVPLTVEQLRAQWRAMVNLAGQQSKNLPALLAMCKPLAVEGQKIVLGFDYPIFKEKFDRTEEAGPLISDAFAQLLGQTYGVRSVVTSDYALPIDKGDFDALAKELGGVVQEERPS